MWSKRPWAVAGVRRALPLHRPPGRVYALWHQVYGANFVGTAGLSIGTDIFHRRTPDVPIAVLRSAGAVGGDYAYGNVVGRNPVPGSSTFMTTITTGAHTVNSVAKNATGAVIEQLDFGRIATALQAFIAAFSSPFGTKK